MQLIDIALQLPNNVTAEKQHTSSRKKERKVHDKMVSSLTGGLFTLSSPQNNKNTRDKSSFIMKSIAINCQRSADIEAYTLEFLPFHLIKSKSQHSIAGEMLADKNFIAQRFKLFGATNAVRLQVTDLLHLRREAAASSKTSSSSRSRSYSNASHPVQVQVQAEQRTTTQHSSDGDEFSITSNTTPSLQSIDVSIYYRDALIQTKEEVYKYNNTTAELHSSSLIVAKCMSYIGSCFLEGGHPRDALYRLEEAAGIYRARASSVSSSNSNHHCDYLYLNVAKALDASAAAYVKVGEERVALLKYEEALRIYLQHQALLMNDVTDSTACANNYHPSTLSCTVSPLHYNFIYHDAIFNVQNTATLLSKVGFYVEAGRKYEQCIEIQSRIYGAVSVPVAKGLNDYGTFLTKRHGIDRYDDAIEVYAKARAAYKALAVRACASGNSNATSTTSLSYQAALMMLSTASIKVKQKDVAAAILSYQKGIDEIRQLLPDVTVTAAKGKGSPGECEHEVATCTAMLKHVISASMKLGSLKAKRGDDVGALQAYESIIQYVNVNVGAASVSELTLDVGKAHIKCATIRQTMDQQSLAIGHLREALKNYTIKYGVSHRDTQAIAGSLRQLQLQELQESAVAKEIDL